ncbi:MAG: hypothetical protein D6753_17520 [Planctomycetota bacterium]|nr:MAG: hypothetical protein D6753_17520 [Planctomycetota bacterium]
MLDSQPHHASCYHRNRSSYQHGIRHSTSTRCGATTVPQGSIGPPRRGRVASQTRSTGACRAGYRKWIELWICWGYCLVFTTLPALPADRTSEFVGAAEPVTPTEEFGLAVRTTDWRSPAEELASFHVPPGFEVQLVACEPQIAKPLNMAWDDRGRLWVTTTVEYPYPADGRRPARDAIKVLADADGDGEFDTVTTFADGLNIPIGLIPVDSGAISFSIPYLWHLQDTDGDGVADQRTKLLGPFDTTRDTHGMINALRRGHDGWIYACHGFNNQSHVEARDGSQVNLISGSTFCFSVDGLHIELFTRGQVNPFGMTEDLYGNWYTADCHSRPLTALIRRACYPSFGRPHDGVGFAPAMMQHMHQSTAISGVALVEDDLFPPAYRGVFYSGNVMTSRINANRLERRGATVSAVELPDFLTCDDPWFRPVDVQLGPDGALYIADFYNRIIGHYGVPLDHPGRDRTSGRIWRIVARGLDESSRVQRQNQLRDLPRTARMPATELRQWMQEVLGSQNTALRRCAVERLVAQPVLDTDSLSAWCQEEDAPALFRAGCVEVLARRSQLTVDVVEGVLAVTDTQQALCQVMRMAGGWSPPLARPVLERARRALDRVEGRGGAMGETLKAAAELLGRRGTSIDANRLWRLVLLADQDDPMLAHAGRVACAQVLRRSGAIQQFVADVTGPAATNAETHMREALRILAGVDHPDADRELLHLLTSTPTAERELVDLVIQRVASRGTAAEAHGIVRLLYHWREEPDQFVQQVERVWGLVRDHPAAVHELVQAVEKWLDGHLLGQGQQELLQSDNRWSLWLDRSAGFWALQERKSFDGRSVPLLSSHTRGESYRGSLLGPVFSCPKQLSFLIAGHNGPPPAADHRKNHVRLVLVPDGLPIATAYPPRSDIAQRVEWDLHPFAGRPVRLEIVDADDGNAYAWIAAGEFSYAGLDHPEGSANFSRSLRLLNLGLGRHIDPARWDALLGLPWSSASQGWLAAARQRAQGDANAADLIEVALTHHRFDWLERWSTFAEHRPQTAGLGQMSPTRPAAELIDLLDRSGRNELIRRLAHRPTGLGLLEDLLAHGPLGIGEALPHLRERSGQLPPGLQALVDRSSNFSEGAAQGSQVASTLVDERLAALNWAEADRQLGRQVFQRRCAACHRLRGIGNEIAPQLDGAVGRGVKRLAEDILVPNANVDPAFQVKVLLLEDDEIVAGIVQPSDDGQVRVMLNDGSVRIVDASRVVQEKQTARSLMPDNLDTL